MKKGDTWSQIAAKNDMTSAELLALNPGYNINKLQIGEVLTLSASVPYLTMTVVKQEQMCIRDRVDWIRALVAGGVDPARIEKEIPFAGVLLKKDKDLQTLRKVK